MHLTNAFRLIATLIITIDFNEVVYIILFRSHVSEENVFPA